MSRRLKNARKPDGRRYGYSSARIRGMRSRLLNSSLLDDLMEAEETTQLIQLLEDTEYATDLDAELIRGRTSDAIDDALKENIVRTFQKVMGILNDEAFDIVTTLLGRWDLFNVKSVIRGKHIHLPAEQIIESLYAVGQFTPIELKDLASQNDVHAVADTLATWGAAYARPLREAMPEYTKDGNLSAPGAGARPALRGLGSRTAHGQGKRRALALRLLGIQIDSINLLTAFRLLSADVSGMDPMKFFLPGGATVQEDLFLRLAGMSDVDEVLDALKPTPYGAALEEASVTYLEQGSIVVFERALEDYAMRKALTAGLEDPVGVGIVISFLFAKQTRSRTSASSSRARPCRSAERMRKELIRV